MAAWTTGGYNRQMREIGSGMIGMYESTTPPAGWYLCNGSNGTPDLRDYFVKNVARASAGSGGGTGTVTGSTAGTITHGTHHHADSNETDNNGKDKTGYHSENVTMDAHAAMSDNQAWWPPYYALAFIMKG